MALCMTFGHIFSPWYFSCGLSYLRYFVTPQKENVDLQTKFANGLCLLDNDDDVPDEWNHIFTHDIVYFQLCNLMSMSMTFKYQISLSLRIFSFMTSWPWLSSIRSHWACDQQTCYWWPSTTWMPWGFMCRMHHPSGNRLTLSTGSSYRYSGLVMAHFLCKSQTSEIDFQVSSLTDECLGSLQHYASLSPGEFMLIRQTLLNFFQDMHIRVSELLQEHKLWLPLQQHEDNCWTCLLTNWLISPDDVCSLFM